MGGGVTASGEAGKSGVGEGERLYLHLAAVAASTMCMHICISFTF